MTGVRKQVDKVQLLAPLEGRLYELFMHASSNQGDAHYKKLINSPAEMIFRAVCVCRHERTAVQMKAWLSSWVGSLEVNESVSHINIAVTTKRGGVMRFLDLATDLIAMSEAYDTAYETHGDEKTAEMMKLQVADAGGKPPDSLTHEEIAESYRKAKESASWPVHFVDHLDGIGPKEKMDMERRALIFDQLSQHAIMTGTPIIVAQPGSSVPLANANRDIFRQEYMLQPAPPPVDVCGHCNKKQRHPQFLKEHGICRSCVADNQSIGRETDKLVVDGRVVYDRDGKAEGQPAPFVHSDQKIEPMKIPDTKIFQQHFVKPPLSITIVEGGVVELYAVDGASMGHAKLEGCGKFVVQDKWDDIKIGKEFWFIAGQFDGDPIVAHGKVDEYVFKHLRGWAKPRTFLCMELPNGHITSCYCTDLHKTKEEAEKARAQQLLDEQNPDS